MSTNAGRAIINLTNCCSGRSSLKPLNARNVAARTSPVFFLPLVSRVARPSGLRPIAVQPVTRVLHTIVQRVVHNLVENKMNKSELISILAEGTGLTKLEIAAVVDGLIATMRYALKAEKHFELRGLGTFKVVHRKGRRVRNPNTGKMLNVPPKKTVVFRVATDLKRYVNEVTSEISHTNQ